MAHPSDYGCYATGAQIALHDENRFDTALARKHT